LAVGSAYATSIGTLDIVGHIRLNLPYDNYQISLSPGVAPPLFTGTTGAALYVTTPAALSSN